MTPETSAPLSTSAKQRGNVIMRFNTLTRLARGNMSAAGAELTEDRVADTKPGGAGVKVQLQLQQQMRVVDSLARSSS